MLEGSDTEATLLGTLLKWTATDSHWLAQDPSIEPEGSDLQAVVGEVLSALHVQHTRASLSDRKNDTQAAEEMADGEGALHLNWHFQRNALHTAPTCPAGV